MKKILLSFAIFMALIFNANADPFYKGKVINIIVGSSPGGGMSLNAELLSHFLKKHIPGHPAVIVTYKGGAGGVKLGNYLNQSNRKNDGTEIGMLISTTLMSAVLNPRNVQFDLDSFKYIGCMENSPTIVAVNANTGIQALEQVRNKEIKMGSNSARSQTSVVPLLLNKFMGTKFKIVLGYSGTGPIYRAMSTDEVNGVAMVYASLKETRPSWIKDKKVNILGVLSSETYPALSNVPLLMNKVADPKAKKALQFWAAGTFGRSFLVSKNVPQERIDILRQAFNDTMKDPAFLKFASENKFPISPKTWQELDKGLEQMKEIIKNDPDVIAVIQREMGVTQ